MRVLYLHQYFSPPDVYGGLRSYEFAKRLQASGHDVCMLTSSAFLAKEYQNLPRITKTTIAGIPTVVIPVPYSNNMSFPKRIEAFLRFAILASLEVRRHPADVVFATSTPLTIAIPGLAARLWQRIPMVFEVRDLWPELPIAVGALKNPIMRWAARALEWVAYHGSSHIVALSPGMADGVVQRGIPREQVTIIPNSCDIDIFDIPPERGKPIRERLQLTDDQPLVVYTGTFGLINNLTYLVKVAEAMKKIAPEIKFLLVGKGAEYEKIHQLAKTLGVYNDNLVIWEPLPKDQMPAVLSAATIATSTVLPLKELWHNSANKFFDALAAGKPIAINHNGWQADLLNETGAGLVLPADDVTQAAHLLAQFLRDPERIKAASIVARQLAHERFDRDKMAQILEGVLKRVIKAK